MKTIVVIDSGVNFITELKKLNVLKCIEVIEHIDSLEFRIIEKNEMSDEIGHGTSVATILNKYKLEAQFVFIKAFYQGNELSPNLITGILQYIYENIDCDIINLSCGCIQIEDYDNMLKVCQSLLSRGTLIVAAFSNDGEVSYPAYFECVIGVDYSLSCFSPKEFYYIENSCVNIRGIGHAQTLPINEREYKQQSGSSFVVPHIVGMISEQSGLNSFEDTMLFLKGKAKDVVAFERYSSPDKLSRINNAVVFPYSKETDVLLRNSQMLDFTISSVLSTKYQLSLTQKKIDEMNYAVDVHTIDGFGWDDDIDTVIIGHVNMLSKAIKVNLKSLILEKCIEYKKNVMMFDNIDLDELLLERLKEQGNKVFVPGVNEYEDNKYGKLHILNSPVLGVFGTAPKQGKFTLQLLLREYFSKVGYKVVNFGTEPTSPLFGFESCYPYGYNSTVKLSGNNAISYINKEMAVMERNGADLIIVGSQSQTIQTAEGNLGYYNSKQYEIILGAQPDAYLLCIHADDDIEYINRTICFLEAINEAEVLALILFPYTYNNVNGNLTDVRAKIKDECLQEIIETLTVQLGKKIYSFAEPKLMEKLLLLIQNKFV